MNKGFVEVDDQCFFACVFGHLLRNGNRAVGLNPKERNLRYLLKKSQVRSLRSVCLRQKHID